MIKSFLIYCSVLITSLSLIYCGNKADGEGSKVSSEKALLAHKNEIEKQKEDSINKLLNEIRVRIFNHDELIIDMEGWCIMADNSAQIKEVKNIGKNETFSCNKGEYIQKLIIEGKFNGIDIRFLDAKDRIIKEFKKFNLNKKIIYSGINKQPFNTEIKNLKDKYYQNWFDKTNQIQLLYNDSVFYSLKWKNNNQTPSNLPNEESYSDFNEQEYTAY
jgi:hypothetical protein